MKKLKIFSIAALPKGHEENPDIGLDSYDRIIPNQDTLPKGGLGNLIALPLQKRARVSNNSVFIDDNFIPYDDQWAFLSELQKINRSEIDVIVNDAERRGRILDVRMDVSTEENLTPWHRKEVHQPIEDLPKKIEMIIANELFIAKNTLPPALKNRLIRLAAFQNPEFYKAQAMRLPTYDKPRIIACARDYPNHIGLPRGCLEEVRQLFSSLKIKIKTQDELQNGVILAVNFLGELRPEQIRAAEIMLSFDMGTLSATTAFGKTVIAAWLIAKRQVNTLIIVNRKQLQTQWIERLSTFLDLPKGSIGGIGGGRKKSTGLIDVAMMQSLIKKGVVDPRIEEYGHVIIDECHHLPAVSFEDVARHAKAKFITGLSATVIRKDGRHPIITMLCGPIRYCVNAKAQAATRPFKHTMFVRPTSFLPLISPHQDMRTHFQDLNKELTAHAGRNQLICSDVIQAIQKGRKPLVLTERNEHLDNLSTLLAPHVPHLIILRGGMSNKTMTETMARLHAIPENETRVVLATGRFIGEGFDDARLDTLFLTLPISWRGTIAQYVGRLHRLHDLKKEVHVYDYVDLNVPLLERMFNKRCRAYESVGYTILRPASATAGWPYEIQLPSDSEWKMDYHASVQRLIRDGIDEKLARLFVEAVSTSPLQHTGIRRARSETEAFLYHRLESMPETAGKFHLNMQLAIPFDGLSQMEVDFVCPDAHIAIEIDGAHHFADPDAYRRDRRKDVLLQEHGYLVLRFLAEDVGQRLDDILNTVIRALSRAIK